MSSKIRFNIFHIFGWGDRVINSVFWIMTLVISKSDEVSIYSEEEGGDGGHFSACLFPN